MFFPILFFLIITNGIYFYDSLTLAVLDFWCYVTTYINCVENTSIYLKQKLDIGLM